MTEFADVGAYCHYDLCKQQSFLPFDFNYFKHTFCEHHRNPKDHECKQLTKNDINTKKLKKRSKTKCKVKGCQTKTSMLIKCGQCNADVCSDHRHCDLHNCPNDKTEHKHNGNDNKYRKKNIKKSAKQTLKSHTNHHVRKLKLEIEDNVYVPIQMDSCSDYAWHDCDDESGRRIKKKILIRNNNENAVCIDTDIEINISYKIYYIDDDVIECILCVRDKMDNIIVDDDDRFTNAFHMALKTMRNGEKALFKIVDKQLLNIDDVYVSEKELKENKLNHNKMISPNDKDTFYEIHIHTANEYIPMDEFECGERIDFGLKQKNKGNELFKQNRYNCAINKYTKALQWIDFEFEEHGNEHENEKNELYIDINNNLALIYVKMKKWLDAIKYSTNVLIKDPDNIKALMRRGQSRLEDLSFDKCEMDLNHALTLQKNNNCIKKWLKTCTNKRKEYVEKEKQLYGGMYGKNKISEKKNEVDKDKSNIVDDKLNEQDEQKNEYTQLKCKYDLIQKKYNKKKKLIKQLRREKNVSLEESKQLKVEMSKQEQEHKQEIGGMLNIKLSYKKMEEKYNDLKNKYESSLLQMYKLETKYKKQQTKFGYKTWDCRDITKWIVELDKVRYNKYSNILLINLMNENIDGQCLADLDKNDLHRLGITCFKDKFYIYNAIKKLTNTDDMIKHNDKNDKESKECIVCMDNIRTMVCVPCGHLCVCAKCKKSINKSCPICQKPYVSLLKIYT